MNWSLITIPAPEELSFGYAATFCETASTNLLRRFFIVLFAAIGLLVGIQLAFADSAESGQRRLAETHLAERKGPCRECSEQILVHSNAEGTSNAPSPASSIH